MAFCQHANIRAYQNADSWNDLKDVSAAIRIVRLLKPECRHDPWQYPVIGFGHDGAAIDRPRLRASQLVLPKNNRTEEVQVFQPYIRLKAGSPEPILGHARYCWLALPLIHEGAYGNGSFCITFSRVDLLGGFGAG